MIHIERDIDMSIEIYLYVSICVDLDMSIYLDRFISLSISLRIDRDVTICKDIDRYKSVELYRYVYGLSGYLGLFLCIKGPEHEANNSTAI
jgi:hypothetical protein